MNFSTIHISSTNIKLTAMRGNSVRKWNTLPLDPGLVRDGRIMDPPRVGEVIDNLFRSVSVPRNNVTITVSGLPYTYRLIDFPKMKPNMVEEAMNNNLSSEFTVPIENLDVSWAPVNTKPDSIEYFVIAVDRQYVNAIIETAKFARINYWSLDIRPLALARAAAQKNAIIVSLDYDYVDMVLVQNGQIKDMHSANVDMDLDGSNRNNYINLFSSELAKLISYHANTKNAESLSTNIPIIITGETLATLQKTADSQGLLEELKKTTGYPVQFVETSVPCPKKFNEADYATNLGLGLRRLKYKAKTKSEFHDIKLDMLQGKYDKKPQTLNISYIILPAIVVIAVVVTTAVISGRNQNNTEITRLQDEVNRVNQSLKQARAEQAEELKIQDQINAVTADIQTSKEEYNQLLGNKGKNAPDLTLVTSVLPEGADFRLISMDVDQIAITGIVNDPLDVIKYIRSLEESGYINLNIQFLGELENDTEYPFQVVVYKTLTP